MGWPDKERMPKSVVFRVRCAVGAMGYISAMGGWDQRVCARPWRTRQGHSPGCRAA